MSDLRALVVDDSKVGRLTMQRKLEAMGLHVDLAESGPQALDWLSRQQPDLIFLDHMMPDMDGFEVTRRIKTDPALRDIPVILVSGNDEAGFREMARQAGALDAMAKPPATEALESLLAGLSTRAAEAATASPATAPAVPREGIRGMVEDALTALWTEFDQRLARQAAALDAVNERLAALAAHPVVDPAALAGQLERGLAAGLAAQQARTDAQSAEFENARQAILVRLDAEAAEWAAQTAFLRQRVEGLVAELARLEDDLRTTRSDLEAGLAGLAAAREQTARTQAGELAALRAELAGLAARFDEARLREWLAEAMAAADTVPAGAGGEVVRHEEFARLRAGLRRLVGFTLLGGTLLLAIVLWTLLRG